MSDNIFERNLSVLKTRNPDLARRLLTVCVPSYHAVVQSKSGHPVLRLMSITFHSCYNPVVEGRQFVETHCALHPCSGNNSRLVVFGFGYGYHLKAMAEANLQALVVEPRIEIIRDAAEHVDLSDVFGCMDVITDAGAMPELGGGAVIWDHRPSVKYSQSDFRQLQQICRRPEGRVERGPLVRSVKKTLKIMVVSPVYGGSLPVAGYCSRALQKLGHEVEFFDASMFDHALQKALSLDLDEKNSHVLQGLFQHLISEMVMATCAHFKPDLVLALAQAPLSVQALQRLRELEITTAFWFVEDYHLREYWKTYAPWYDFYFTIQDDGFFQALDGLGVHNHHYLPMAADPGIHRPLELSGSDMLCYGSDVSFMGAGYYNRENLFLGLLDFDFKIWGSGWNPSSALSRFVQRGGQRLTTADTVKVYNATRVNINLHSSVCHQGIDPQGDFVNPRTFEIGACRAFQLVDQRSFLGRHFDIGTEILCYSDLEELREKLQHYIKHPAEASRVAQRAHERILREHTYEQRMAELLDVIRDRKPECFHHQVPSQPTLTNIDEFCTRQPELRSLMERVSCRGGTCEIDDIVTGILSGGGPLQQHEALFLMLKEFVELRRGASI